MVPSTRSIHLGMLITGTMLGVIAACGDSDESQKAEDTRSSFRELTLQMEYDGPLRLAEVEVLVFDAPDGSCAQATADSIEPPSPQEILNQKLDLFARQLQVSRRVLVVDDEPVILRVITEYLAQNSILADVVTTAEEGLERMSERDYAVVETDKNLPGMDGIELLKEIKVLRELLPICSGCKRIRDEIGKWWPLDAYVKKHTDSEFTHTVCPDCKDVFYSDI